MGDKSKRRAPVMLVIMLALLTLVTITVVGGVAYGFYTGWLLPYWENLSDAHAAILAQLIFFFAAAWASLLVPLLFREQLQNLEDAAKRAEETYTDIQGLMTRTTLESEKQFKKILQLQMLSVGHLLDEQLIFLQTPEEKKLFVDTQWDKAKAKVDTAIGAVHGAKRNSINLETYRSSAWWGKVKEFDVLGDQYEAFRMISDKKNKHSLDVSDLQAVNEAARKVEAFTFTRQAPAVGNAVPASAGAQTVFVPQADAVGEQPLPN